MPMRHGGSALEECQKLATPELLPNDHLFGRVDPVNLEYILSDIQPDRSDLHVDGSRCDSIATVTLRHSVAGSGRRPPHQFRTHAPHKNRGDLGPTRPARR